MQQYIGVKLINATMMNRQQYNDFRGWGLPADENGADPGMLVEYIDGGAANTDKYEGYVSWSPLEVFDEAYRVTDGMSFGLAIEAAKLGLKVARTGWNGKGMFIFYSPGHPELTADQAFSGVTEEIAIDNGGAVCVSPCLHMFTADKKIQPGWLASQTDMLADDWQVV